MIWPVANISKVLGIKKNGYGVGQMGCEPKALNRKVRINAFKKKLEPVILPLVGAKSFYTAYNGGFCKDISKQIYREKCEYSGVLNCCLKCMVNNVHIK